MSNTRRQSHTAVQQQLLEECSGLVRLIAQDYASNSRAHLEDLIQVGFLGLLNAAQRFSESNGVPLTHYARPHIRGAILHYLRDQFHLVRLPRRQHEKLQRRLLQGRTDQSPDNDLLEQWTALSRPLALAEIGAFETPGWRLLTGSCPSQASEHDSDHNYRPMGLPDEWSDISVQRLLGMVDRRKRQVLRCVVLQGWSYRRTAGTMGVSAPTVQRLLRAGLKELRTALCGSVTTGLSEPRHHAPSALSGC